MKKLLFAGSFLAMALLISSCDKDDDDDAVQNLSATDSTFLVKANIGNRAEILSGQMAVQKGTSAGVKAYGQMMITDHQNAQNDLKDIAEDMNRWLADTLDREHLLLMQRLSTLSGLAFDTAYLNSQVKDHQATIALYQTEINSGTNQDLKNYATRYLPAVQLHHHKADSLRKTFP